MLYGAAKRSHDRKIAREAKRADSLNRKRSALQKMQETHKRYKDVRDAQWTAANFRAYIETAKSSFWIAVYAVPTLALVAGLIRFVFWIL